MPPKRKTVAQSSSLSAALGRGERPAVITFDRDARRDYLTGFHKRKLQRIKQAKAVAADIEKQAKLDARKQMRDRRKEELEELVRSGHEAARKAARLAAGKPLEPDSESEGDDDDDDDGGGGGGDGAGGVEGSGGDAARQLLDREEQYVDEDRFTTVTVREMDLNAASTSETEDGDGDGEGARGGDGPKADGTQKEKKKWPKKPKEKKKKFRYLTKAERKTDRFKLKQKKSKMREKFKSEKKPTKKK